MAELKPVTSKPILGMLGRYELLALLGRGGMAEVYRARLPGAMGVHKLVAVKRILPGAHATPELVDMFVHEARLSSLLMHPNVVQIFELGRAGNELFIAMELVEGPDLRKVLTANQSLGKITPLEIAICILLGVLRGLDYAHRLRDEEGKPLHVVHRDLSPANVLLSFEGAIKVADFGVARAGDVKGARADAGKVRGKLQYMAPEQILAGEIDARADVFAAGCVLYEMLTNRPVFEAPSVAELVQKVAAGRIVPASQIMPSLEPELVKVLHRALASRPEARFGSCEELSFALRRLVQQGRIPCASEPELALYLQVLLPREPHAPELVHTPMSEPITRARTETLPARELRTPLAGTSPPPPPEVDPPILVGEELRSDSDEPALSPVDEMLRDYLLGGDPPTAEKMRPAVEPRKGKKAQ